MNKEEIMKLLCQPDGYIVKHITKSKKSKECLEKIKLNHRMYGDSSRYIISDEIFKELELTGDISKVNEKYFIGNAEVITDNGYIDFYKQLHKSRKGE